MRLKVFLKPTFGPCRKKSRSRPPAFEGKGAGWGAAIWQGSLPGHKAFIFSADRQSRAVRVQW